LIEKEKRRKEQRKHHSQNTTYICQINSSLWRNTRLKQGAGARLTACGHAINPDGRGISFDGAPSQMGCAPVRRRSRRPKKNLDTLFPEGFIK